MISDRPFWLDTVSEADFHLPGQASVPELPTHARTAIIGGGIVGLACAHYLAAAGAEGVLLLERGKLLHEASAANGGGLWPAEQAPGVGPFYDLARASLDLLLRFAGEADGELELREHGVLALACSEDEAEALRARTDARREAGLAVEWLPPAEARALEPEVDPQQVHGAAWYPEDRHVNPARLGAAFARSALRGGVRIFPGVAVRGFEKLDHVTRLFTGEGMLDVAHVVVTTGAWAKEFSQFLGLTVPVEPAKGQLVATAPLPPLLRHAVIGTHGVLQTAGGNILSGGTVEHVGFDTEPRAEVRERIWERAQALVPALRGVPLTHSWARFRPHTPDGLPLIGFCDPEQRHLMAAGHFKNGLLLSAVSGRIVADLLTRGDTLFPLAGVDPRRFSG
jgi:glycine oxidase